MAYPSSVDDLTSGIPADGIAAATPLGSVSYPMDDWAREVGTAVEAIETELVGAYDSYTPTLTAATTDPTLGTASSAVGYYKQIGRMVHGYAHITFGSSGAAAGAGLYGLLLPVEPVDRTQPIGIGYVFDYDDSLRFVVCSAAISPPLWAASTRKAVLLITNPATEGFSTGDNPVGAANPWTWAEQDQVVIKFDYEALASA